MAPTNDRHIPPQPSVSDMAFTHLDVVAALYLCFDEGALNKLLPLFHENAVWIQMEGFPGGGTYKGKAAIFQQVFYRLKEDWVDWKATPESFVEAQDAVFVIGSYTGRYRTTDKAFVADFIHYYEFEGRKIIRFKQYTDTFQIAKAMDP